MNVTPASHLGALALVLLDILARAARCRLCLPIGFWQAAEINTVGDSVSYITPLRFAGEPLRFLGFLRRKQRTSRVLALFAIELAMDALVLVVSGVALSVAFAQEGLGGVARLAELLHHPFARWVAIITVLSTPLGILLALRMRRRLPVRFRNTLGDAWRRVRHLPPRTSMAVLFATIVSTAARTAVLPVLAASAPGLPWGGVVLGSFLLSFGAMFVPTPAGAGAIDLGFVAGFENVLNAEDRVKLLAVWRFYTLVVPVAVGLVLLARAGLQHWIGKPPSGGDAVTRSGSASPA